MTTTPVHLDLDALERPARPEPFKITLGGRSYTLVDVKADVDQRVISRAYEALTGGDAMPLIELVVPEDDRAAFFAQRVPMWQLEALFNAYNEHYGIEAPPVSGVG